jgi:hypothetical protein
VIASLACRHTFVGKLGYHYPSLVAMTQASVAVNRGAPRPQSEAPAMTSPHRPTRAFTPDQLRAMLDAFDVVCVQLHLPAQGNRETKRVASRIFDLAMAGETSTTLADFFGPGIPKSFFL